jgi:hypothetical protein
LTVEIASHAVRQYTPFHGDRPAVPHYYIVLIENKLTRSSGQNLIGPLTYSQFMSKRRELNISDSVHFTKEYPNPH